MEETVVNSADTAEMDLIGRARALRDSRHALASQLAMLINRVEPQLARDVMDKLDNDTLDNLPHWCSMDDTSLVQFQRLIGAMFILPALRQSIDGRKLLEWQSVMGKPLFDAVMGANVPESSERLSELSQTLPPADDSLLLANGASILLSTVTDPAAQTLLQQRFDTFQALVDKEHATQIHAIALATLARSVQSVAASNTSSDPAGSQAETRAVQ